LPRLVPLLLLALIAMALPINVGGWGPREAVTTWTFAAAGLNASQGLTMAVVYGLLAMVASLPGAAVLIGRRLLVRPVAVEPPTAGASPSGAMAASAVPAPDAVTAPDAAGVTGPRRAEPDRRGARRPSRAVWGPAWGQLGRARG